MTPAYSEELRQFRSGAREQKAHMAGRRLEWVFESLKDWSVFGSTEQALDWLNQHRLSTDMRVTTIPLKECDGWRVDPGTGNIASTTGDFFIVEGIRVRTGKRERERGWDQPIITQVGFDGGIIGLLTQRWDGIPHYLVEAKAEPGNPGLVQLSPTLQATFSNLNQAHGGRRPHFSTVFTDPQSADATVLVDYWMSEDGGRLRNKRNQGMIVEVAPDSTREAPETFTWMSLYQIREIVRMDALVGPHIRSLLSLM